jgi:hypothetical protein
MALVHQIEEFVSGLEKGYTVGIKNTIFKGEEAIGQVATHLPETDFMLFGDDFEKVKKEILEVIEAFEATIVKEEIVVEEKKPAKKPQEKKVELVEEKKVELVEEKKVEEKVVATEEVAEE